MRVPRKVSSIGTQVLCEKEGRLFIKYPASYMFCLIWGGCRGTSGQPKVCCYVKQHTLHTARCTNDPENRNQKDCSCG